MSKAYSLKDVQEKRELKFGDSAEFVYHSIDIMNGVRCVKIVHEPCGRIFTPTIKNHLKGCGCPKCSKNFQYSISELEKERESKFHDSKQYIYHEIKSKNGRRFITLTHIPCGKKFERSVTQHLKGVNCRKCSKDKITYSIEDVKNLREEEFGDSAEFIYHYFLYKNESRYLKLTHLNCGRVFTQKASNHVAGCGCKECSSPSRAEKKIATILNSFNISFEKEKTFEGCSNIQLLPFDFFISSKNLLIEYDGKQHFKPIKYFGGKDRFLLRVKNDNIKNEFCKKNNITLLRIPYWDYNNIEKILSEWILEKW